jgi:lysophospholipid acyltransferase (LPLAT)-like uncharacterized protein
VKLSKRILKSEGFRAIACWLAAALIRFVHMTNRWQTVRGEIPKRYWDRKKPFIVCFWHGRIMQMRYCWDMTHPICMLISDHQDGQLIARTNTHFGINTVVGSSSKGGARAIREMVRLLKSGDYIGITPDGPRGPRMRASDGTIALARLTSVPIIPVSYSTSRGKHLRSWDRFLVAKPFGKGVIVWGEPIEVPRDADKQTIENARIELENNLNTITNEADELVGRAIVEPEPLTSEPEVSAK